MTDPKLIKLDQPGPYREMKLIVKMPGEGRVSVPVHGLLRGAGPKRDLTRVGTLAWDDARGRYTFASAVGMTSDELRQMARWLEELGRR